MTTAAFSITSRSTNLLRPILVGGAIAGTFDLTCAFFTFGLGAPRGIAGGLLGRQAVLQGGAGIWILGFLLHYFIAISAAGLYCLASRKLELLRDHWLVCGIFYGIAIWLVMNRVVLPLSAYHFTGPYQFRGMLQGLLVHMFIIGLPISFSLRRLTGSSS
jgi:hypothetical protein